jgi:uncharacterized protein
MSKASVEVARRTLEAFNGGDIEGTLALVHPDFEASVPVELSAEPDTYRGHDGVRRYFESFSDDMDEIRFEVEQFFDAGESVVVDTLLTAKGRRTGIHVAQRSAGVLTIRDGKLIRLRAYVSLSEALEAVGLER